MIASSIRRARIAVEDGVRYSRLVREALGRYRLATDPGAGPADDQGVARQIVRLCGAARLAPDGPLLGRVEARLRQKLQRLDVGRIDWPEFVPKVDDRRITKGAVIKPWVGPGEKGVVFISFEDQWARLLYARDLKAFAERYTLVVAPTWCPPHSLVNVAFPAAYPGDEIFTLISNEKDVQNFPRLSPKYRVVPLYASSWVNPAFYNPRPRGRRDVDVVMVANFGKYKRHHALFRALRRMDPAVRVTLIGQGQDTRDAETIRGEARLFGVGDRVTVCSSVTNEFLADALCRARVSLILSRREGSCVAVAESMFADTPVGLLKDAEVGSRAFVNPATGRLLDEGRLAEDLSAFLAAADDFSPRAWAEQTISCHQSSRALNEALRQHAQTAGRPWTRDVATLYWRPDPTLADPAHAAWASSEADSIRDRFGLDFRTATAPPGAGQGAPTPVAESAAASTIEQDRV